MDRREAIKRTALLTGFAVSSSTLAALLQGCQAESRSPLDSWTPQFFTHDEGRTLAEIGECILPRTDTPGAIDVYTHEFVDQLVGECMDAEEQTTFRKGLAQLDAKCQEAHGQPFVACGPEQRLALLNKEDQAARDFIEKHPGLDEEDYPFFLKLKEVILMGYFTSEKVGTEVTAYDPIPAGYEPCRPYEEGTPGWSANR